MRNYLIKNGNIITVDATLGNLPEADIRVQNGAIAAIGRGLEADGDDVIDASGMIVMPGLVDSHFHMWSTLGRNFICDDGFGYYPAKWATSHLYSVDDFHASVLLGLAELASGGVTTVHNWCHNTRSPQHTDAELRAHQQSLLRGRYSLGHIDKLPPDVVNGFDDLDRVVAEWFAEPGPLNGLVHLGINLRGLVQSDARVFHAEMEHALRRGLPVAIHATQARPNVDDAADYERRGYLGPNFLFCHYIAATQSDREALARTRTPLSFATLSELRLSSDGDPREAFLKMRDAGVSISLSSDATSIAPPNMFEAMRATWNMAVPWRDSDTAGLTPLSIRETIQMATLRGAEALRLGAVTGLLTTGKRADIILIDPDGVNIAPMSHLETTVLQSATPANVDTVMVDGCIIKRHKRLVGWDVRSIVDAAKKSAFVIQTRAGGVLAPYCRC